MWKQLIWLLGQLISIVAAILGLIGMSHIAAGEWEQASAWLLLAILFKVSLLKES